MAVLGISTAEHSWAHSIADAVGPIADRDVRWNGLLVVHDKDTPSSRTGTSEMLHGLQQPLILPQRHLDALRPALPATRTAARTGPGAELTSEQLAGFVEATAYMGAQAVRLSSPLPDNLGTTQTDADLNAGLADVWIQERLSAVWRSPEFDEFRPAGEPELTYAGGSPATAATRGLVSEVLKQQSWQAGARSVGAICDRLLDQPPDRRWETLVAMMPGGDRVPEDQLWRRGDDLRRDFGAAVQLPEGDLREAAAAKAVRDVAAQVRSAAGSGGAAADIRLAHDPASPSARDAVGEGTEHGATDSSAKGKQSGHKRWRIPGLGGRS